MAKPIFMGIENEFQVMDRRTLIEFGDIFGKALSRYHRPIHKKTDTAIRTRIGSAIYQDIQVAEACTPPVRLCRGFATQLTDLLYLSRKELLEFVAGAGKQYSLIGYSTHYNISYLGDLMEGRFMLQFGVPISLLTLNPASKRNYLETKDSPGRFQLRADFLLDEDQTRAFLNFYAGAMLHFFFTKPEYTDAPFKKLWSGNDYNNAEKGRYTKVVIETKDGKKRIIYAQDYLEIYYDFLKRAIASLATPEEVKNLEAFISGDKQLEADRIKAALAKACLQHDAVLSFMSMDPSFTMKPEMFAQERPIPTKLAKAMGRFASDTGHYNPNPEQKEKDCEGCVKIDRLEWNYAINTYPATRYIARSTEDFERLGEMLAGCTTAEQISRRIELIKEIKYHEERVWGGRLEFENPPRGFLNTLLEIHGLARDGRYTRQGLRIMRAYTRDYQFTPRLGRRPAINDLDARLEAAEAREMSYDPAQDSSYDLGELARRFPGLKRRTKKERALEMFNTFPELRQAIRELK